MIRLSVVVTSYNQMHRLRLVLRGLQAQTLPHDEFEILVVDDASTDGSVSMVRRLGLSNLRIIRQARNGGMSAARNRGVLEARAPVIVFLDGDALPSPGFLEAHRRLHRTSGAFVSAPRYSTTATEFLDDPGAGTLLQVSLPAFMARHLRDHIEQFRISEQDILNRVAIGRTKTQLGCYPTEIEREREQQINELFDAFMEPRVGWMGWSGHNGSVGREAYLAVGGLDERLTKYAEVSLAYRLFQKGEVPRRLRGEATYHLYHYRERASNAGAARHSAGSGAAEVVQFERRHGSETTALFVVWMQSVADQDPWLPDGVAVRTLIEAETLVRQRDHRRIKACAWIMDHHPQLGPLLRQVRARVAPVQGG